MRCVEFLDYRIVNCAGHRYLFRNVLATGKACASISLGSCQEGIAHSFYSIFRLLKCKRPGL